MTWRQTGRYDQSSESCKPCNSSRGLKKSLPDFFKKKEMGQFYKNSVEISLAINQSQQGVFYLQKWWISVLHSQKRWISWKCALFIEKITSFYKNSNWHTYKKLHFWNFQKKNPLQLSTKVPYIFLSFYFAWMHGWLNAVMSLNILSFFQYLHDFVFHSNPQFYMLQECPFLTRWSLETYKTGG